MYDPLCLVMELPANGDLLSYLINCRQEVREGGEGVRERGVGGREGGREIPYTWLLSFSGYKY